MDQFELRLNNLISYRGETDCIVTSLGRHGFETVKNDKYEMIYGSDDIRDYEPIEITHDWLIEHGFKHVESDKIYNREDICLSYFDAYPEYKLYVNHEYEVGKPIQYVHQLQNLYFDLHQTELKKEF